MTFKQLSKSKNVSDLEVEKLHWDFNIDGVPYQVVRINGYYQTFGGKWGKNDLYCYPLNEKMSYDNLIPFDSDNVVDWGFRFDTKSIIRWGNGFNKDTETRDSTTCYITRNGKDFYRISGREMSYCMAKAQVKLVELHEQCIFNVNEMW